MLCRYSSSKATMWTSLEPNCRSWEPNELRDLKCKLANLSCKCKSCERAREPDLPELLDARSPSPLILAYNDKQIQVQQKISSFDQYTQVNPQTIITDHNLFHNTLTKDVLCPSCFVTMNLLRGGVLRVLKDEESETSPRMFSCDKTTELSIKGVEESTSITRCKAVTEVSDLTLCDFITECSSDLSEPVPFNRSKSPHQVKFIDIDVDEVKGVPGGCTCLENFMDAIRPPLIDSLFISEYKL